MKMFFVTEFIDMSISVKIKKDDGTWIVLRGKSDDQHMPAAGVALDEGSQEKLIEWVNKK